METDEAVEMVEGVLVNMVGGRSGDIKGVTTLVEDGTCNEDGGEGTVGGRDGEDAETDSDTIAVGVKERDEEEEYVIAGDSLEGLSSIVLNRLCS
jgi:hypothetical protein